jgi:hypothetical protein
VLCSAAHVADRLQLTLSLRSARLARWWPRALGVVLVVLAVTRVVATYADFSQTFDEPAHVAAGMEWLDRGRYTYELQTPPLARVAAALGPYLDGLRSTGDSSFWREGNAILNAQDSYARNLELSRFGELPFFLLAIGMAGIWAHWLFGSRVALLTIALFSSIPPVLAHAGLATTDIALVGTLSAALFVLARWLERPTIGWSIALGATIGLALLAKFTAAIFLIAGAVLVVGLSLTWTCRRPALQWVDVTPWRAGRSALTATVIALLVVWAGYRFSLGTIRGVPVPAPEFIRGLVAAGEHGARGHASYLLGQPGATGWWYFFPLTLAVKTPIPLLLLGSIGAIAAIVWYRRRRDGRVLLPLVLPLVMLGAVMPSTIDLGVRHVLPVYVFMSVLASLGVVVLWSALAGNPRLVARTAVIGLLVWQGVSSTRAHPDYLAYFNELAGPEPGRILVDSDLDWGQDLYRLGDAAREHQITQLAFAYFGSADPRKFGLSFARPLQPGERPSGWVAISETRFRRGVEGSSDAYSWLDAYQPVARIGSSIRLYLLPAPPSTPSAEVPASVRS